MKSPHFGKFTLWRLVVAEIPGTVLRELRLYSSYKGLSAKVEFVAQGNQ
jgi:hypothetical protein